VRGSRLGQGPVSGRQIWYTSRLGTAVPPNNSSQSLRLDLTPTFVHSIHPTSTDPSLGVFASGATITSCFRSTHAPSAEADVARASRQQSATSARQGQRVASLTLASRGVCSTAAPRRESEQKAKVIEHPRVRESVHSMIGEEAAQEANRCNEPMPQTEEEARGAGTYRAARLIGAARQPENDQRYGHSPYTTPQRLPRGLGHRALPFSVTASTACTRPSPRPPPSRNTARAWSCRRTARRGGGECTAHPSTP
jgi:hypothetical protein